MSIPNSKLDFNKVITYEEYLGYKYELLDLIRNDDCLTCIKCLRDIKHILLECGSNRYTASLNKYKDG